MLCDAFTISACYRLNMSTQPDPDSLKMFVGQIPKTMNEAELKEMMEEYGPVYQVGIIRDKESSESKGLFHFYTVYSVLRCGSQTAAVVLFIGNTCH